MLEAAKWVLLFSCVSLVALQSVGQDSHYQQSQDAIEDGRQGRNLLDWIGFGTGPETDPYLAKTNAACLNGDLAECFKSRALGSFEEFFSKPEYHLSETAKIRRMPEGQLRQLAQEPYEFSESPRSDEPEWDQLVKFAKRKVEKFLKSTSFELNFNDEVTDGGRYAPRFIDEIVGEIDVIEDKKDTLFRSFFGSVSPQYTPSGIAYQPQHSPSYHHEYPQYGGGVHFRNDEESAQNLAYNGWSQYRNKDTEIAAESSSKKSILPDS